MEIKPKVLQQGLELKKKDTYPCQQAEKRFGREKGGAIPERKQRKYQLENSVPARIKKATDSDCNPRHQRADENSGRWRQLTV